MPSRSSLPANGHGGRRQVSRKRYDNVEAQRTALIERLSRLDGQEKANPGYKSAKMLLHGKFRVARIDQRIEILKAADWLIKLLEKEPELDGRSD